MTSPPRKGAEAPVPGHERQRDLRVMFVAAEIYPLAKTGGLADVCGALPMALAQQGMDVRLMLPAYPEALERLASPGAECDLGEVLPGLRTRLIEGRMPGTGLPVWLVDCPHLFRRSGSLYQDPGGRDWADNAQRFALLSHAAARVAVDRAGLDWRADIVHVHDWHVGLVPRLLAASGRDRPRTVFTIHNMAFQGLFPLGVAPELELPRDVLSAECGEYYGQLSFLKAGIVDADMVTTVSPTYAREIRTAEFGFGMEGVLQHRGDRLCGILNGIDTKSWNPATDPFLPHRYSSADLSGKRVCKSVLQKELGLHVDPDAPLAVSLSRLTQQKMIDVVLDRLPSMLARHPRLQVAVHGRGEHALEQGLASLAHVFPGRLSVNIGYREDLEHRMHAGADVLLHGSRFEPCGLAQLYAMHYGTLPIVRHVGGLADSVIDAGEPPHRTIGSTGFVFQEASGDAMESALDRCLEVYRDWPQTWSDMRKLAMSADFGWSRSAREYAELYAGLVPSRVADRKMEPAREARVAPASSWAGLDVVAGQQVLVRYPDEEDRRARASSRGGRT